MTNNDFHLAVVMSLQGQVSVQTENSGDTVLGCYTIYEAKWTVLTDANRSIPGKHFRHLKPAPSLLKAHRE